MLFNGELLVQNLDHLDIVAGLVDELKIVEQINQHLGEDPREQTSPGVAVKAMVLNGLGLVSAPLYCLKNFCGESNGTIAGRRSTSGPSQ